MGGRISISAKRLGVTLLTIVVFVFIWDEMTAHPWGPKLYFSFCVETGDGCNRGWVAANSPDTETSFDGKEGYAWEIKPISISGSEAVINFRVKHFDHFAPAADMRRQLEQSEFRRLILRPEQPLTVEGPDGAKLSLTY